MSKAEKEQESAGRIGPPKTFRNIDAASAQANVPDLQIVGNGDAWRLLVKAYSERENWMKSTKAMEIAGVGCLVQVTTQQGTQVAEAVAFVPDVRIVEDEKGG